MNQPLKRCISCSMEYSATPEHFHRDKTKSDGLDPRCKHCRKDNAHQYFLKNKESILQKNADRRKENPDKATEQARKWAERNPEKRKRIVRKWIESHRPKIAEAMRNWRKENKEHYLQYDREYNERNRERKRANAQRAREKNRDRYRSYQHQYRTRKLANGGSHTAEDIQRQYESQQGCCFWCSVQVTAYHVDHVIPLSRGGSDYPENIVIACPTCNTSKNDKIPYTEWVPPKPLC